MQNNKNQRYSNKSSNDGNMIKASSNDSDSNIICLGKADRWPHCVNLYSNIPINIIRQATK